MEQKQGLYCVQDAESGGVVKITAKTFIHNKKASGKTLARAVA